MDPTTYAVIAAAVLVGSVVQSAVGLGVGLVAAPVTALLEPALMPGALLMVALLMPCLTLVNDHHDIDWRGLGWSLPARVPGTVVGVWVVTALSARRARDRDRGGGARRGRGHLAGDRGAGQPGTLSAAGFASGITGTATSIGGPPIAIVYQHRPAQEIRTTMAVYFLVGAGALAWSALLRQRRPHPRPGAWPPWSCCRSSLLGAVLGALARRSIPAHVVRPAVLLVSSALGAGAAGHVRSLGG